MNNLKSMFTKKSVLLLAVVFFMSLNVLTGCARSSKSVTTETVSSPHSQTTTVEKETHTSDDHDYGILGGAFHVVGEVLAFPFEVVAGLFRFIF